MSQPTRKHGKHLRVPVLPNEEEAIKANASRAGLSVAEYLRRLALGYEIRSAIDQQQVLELAKINADLGRLGGLLKLWLSNDERLRHIEAKTITVLLDQIRLTQTTLLNMAKRA